VFRYETLDSVNLPIDNDFKTFPRVCRVRNLLSAEPLKPRAEFHRFNRQVYQAVAVGESRYFIVRGSHDGPDGRYSAIGALEGTTGKELWSVREGDEYNFDENFAIDGGSEDATIWTWDRPKRARRFLDARTGTELRPPDRHPGTPGHVCKYYSLIDPFQRAIAVYGDDRLLVNLGIDQKLCSDNAKSLSRDGKCLAWGNADGSVMIADLDVIQSRLARVGLSWASSSIASTELTPPPARPPGVAEHTERADAH
jgi:hypothetical protein